MAGNVTVDILTLMGGNPALTISVLIQIILGFALGYIMAKMIKYVVAFIAIMIIGMLLNVWSLGMSINDIIASFGSEAIQFKDVIIGLVTALGILTVGPITLGFLIGILVGLIRR